MGYERRLLQRSRPENQSRGVEEEEEREGSEVGAASTSSSQNFASSLLDDFLSPPNGGAKLPTVAGIIEQAPLIDNLAVPGNAVPSGDRYQAWLQNQYESLVETNLLEIYENLVVDEPVVGAVNATPPQSREPSPEIEMPALELNDDTSSNEYSDDPAPLAEDSDSLSYSDSEDADESASESDSDGSPPPSTSPSSSPGGSDDEEVWGPEDPSPGRRAAYYQWLARQQQQQDSQSENDSEDVSSDLEDGDTPSDEVPTYTYIDPVLPSKNKSKVDYDFRTEEIKLDNWNFTRSMIRKFLGSEGGLTLSLSRDDNWGKKQKNSKSIYNHLAEVRNMIENLEDQGIVMEVGGLFPAHISPLAVVPKPDGSLRLIHDLRRINKRLRAPKFHLPTVFSDLRGVPLGGYMTSIDFKNAYYNVPIHPDFQKFLGFEVDGKTYVWKRMPFGLNIAPWVWTKIVDAVTTELRKRGVNAIVYLDDWLIWAETKEEAKRATDIAVEFMNNLGLRINIKKSVLTPVQKLKYLGFILNSKTQEITLTGGSQQQALDYLEAIGSMRIPAKILASMIGYLQFVSQLWPCAGALIRPWYAEIRTEWDQRARGGRGVYTAKPIVLSKDFIQDFTFLVQTNTPKNWGRAEDMFHTYSDATPWRGGFIDETGEWDAFEVPEWAYSRIYHAEVDAGIAAVKDALTMTKDNQPVKSVHLHIDNMGALYTLRKGSSRFADVNSKVAELAPLIARAGARLTLSYIRSEFNPSDILTRDETYFL
jgi:hypothetical protein